MRSEEKSNELVESVYQNLKTIKKVALDILKRKEKVKEAIESDKFATIVLSILLVSSIVFIGLVVSAITVSQVIPRITGINNGIQNGLTPMAALMGALTGESNIETTSTDTVKTRTMIQKTSSQNLQENENMYIGTDNSGDQVPIPKGYVGSKATGENEIDTGYVIYEGEEEVNDANLQEARKNRNQYVWIPVPDVSKFYGIDSNGKLWGKLYDFTTTGIKATNWTETNGVMKISNVTGNREPDIVTKGGTTAYDADSRMKSLQLGTETSHEFLIQLEKEFNEMIKSVEKYGGFYIGRYETGGLASTVVVRKGNTDIGSQSWYTMYKKCKTLKGENDNVVTNIAWGNQFDRTLMWLIESGDKTLEQICKDSGEWGNYNTNAIEYINTSGNLATTVKGTSTRIPSGSSEQTKSNNIYDLAGNVWDWTMEACYANSRRCRGGAYDYSSSAYPASYRDNYYPTSISCSLGCRAALYIK